MAHFISIAELKNELGLDSSYKIDILEDKESGAKSFTIDGIWFRVQKNFDGKLPAIFFTTAEDDNGNPDWTKGCLTNYDDSKQKKQVFCTI